VEDNVLRLTTRGLYLRLKKTGTDFTPWSRVFLEQFINILSWTKSPLFLRNTRLQYRVRCYSSLIRTATLALTAFSSYFSFIFIAFTTPLSPRICATTDLQLLLDLYVSTCLFSYNSHKNIRCRSQCVCGVNREISSAARALGSWVRILLEAWK
jgi:hypothetical protein